MTPEGNDTARTPEDELLARLYQRGTDRQAARYAATYDAGAGLTRFNAWLNEHTAVDPVIAAIKADAGAIPVPSRPASLTQTLAVGDVITPDPFAPFATADMGWSADRAVVELYSAHYRSLVRLAALLVRDTPTAEEVVQDAFVAMHGGWQRLRECAQGPGLPAAGCGEPVPVGVAAPGGRRSQPAKGAAGPAGRRARRPRPAGAAQCRGRAARAARTAARGDRAAVLRGSVRGGDRRRDGHQPRCRQEPHCPRDVSAPGSSRTGHFATCRSSGQRGCRVRP